MERLGRERVRGGLGLGEVATALHGVTAGALGSVKGHVRLFHQIGAPFFRSPQRGARSLVWLALSEEAEGLTGEYVQDEKVIAPSAQAQDDTLAAALWERSAQLVGLPADAIT